MNSYDQTDFEITESLIYYLNNTGSVEIMTKFGLMKVYFPIPTACAQLSNTLSQRIMEEMTSTSPQEAIKYICYKALLIKERLGVEKEVSKVTEISRIVINNVAKLSNISFILLFAYLVFEIWKNIHSSGITSFGHGLCGALLLIISLCVFFSYLVNSYHIKKAQLNSSNIFTKKKKKVVGSLGYSAFPKEINSNEITFDHASEVKKRRIILNMLIDTTNIFNFLMFLLILISLAAYNQIFRAVLLVRVSKIDTNRVLKSRFVRLYPILAKAGLIVLLLVLTAYIYALSDMFFKTNDADTTQYKYDNCDDYWTCTGALLENGITYNTSGLEVTVNAILFVIVLITSTNIILTVLISILLRAQLSNQMSKSENSTDSNIADICLVCGKNRSEFDMKKVTSAKDTENSNPKTTSGWVDHISKEHNIFAYFYYIIYVVDKDQEECDGIELFVKK